ncbi:putative sugar transporter [Cutibacterium acnes HL201PA1]|nr:putative sugar transporter [Cutibacterium acnes HL201PA1]
MGCRQAEDHSDNTVRFRRNSTRICPRTVHVDPFLDRLNVTHTRKFSQFDRVLTAKLTELHTETSDFGLADTAVSLTTLVLRLPHPNFTDRGCASVTTAVHGSQACNFRQYLIHRQARACSGRYTHVAGGSHEFSRSVPNEGTHRAVPDIAW